MKVEIEKLTTPINRTIKRIYHLGKLSLLDNPCNVIKGYTYYIFRTEEKAWIRHSGKLTKEEKQWVIKHEQK